MSKVTAKAKQKHKTITGSGQVHEYAPMSNFASTNSMVKLNSITSGKTSIKKISSSITNYCNVINY
jgi:hypothetical protein